MARSGQVAVQATAQNNLIFSWAAVQSAASNTSTVSWQMLLEAGQYGRIDASPGSPWSVTLDGKTVTGTTSLAIGNNQTKVLAEGQLELSHDALGQRSFDFSFRQEFWIDFGGAYITVVSGQGSAQLDTIPRASQPSLSANSVELGKGLTIYTNRVSDFTHTLEYSFAEASGVIAQGVGDRCDWYPSMELARQIPDNISGTATITCTTYAGGTPIGQKQVTVTLTVPENVVPMAEASWEDTSGAYGLLGSLVQNVSKLAVTISGTGAYGSTITGASVLLEGRPYGGGVLTSDGNLTLTVSVTDSRGRVGTKPLPITVAPYSVPSLTLSASRYDRNGNPDDAGDMARITVTGYVAQVNGNNSTELILTYSDGEVREELGTGDIFYQTDLIYADANATMVITAVLCDKLMPATQTMVLSTGYATLDLLAGGKGISFGKAATREGFDCAMPAYFSGGLYGMTDEKLEWVNPPMVLGVEYRTTERWNGKVVYTKAISVGSLPNAASRTVDSIVTDGCTEIFYARCRYIYSTLSVVAGYDGTYGWLTLISTSDLSGYDECVTLKYTKD